MKKLFLYLSIVLVAIGIFVVAFVLTRDYFRDNSLKVVADEPIELTENESIDVMEYGFNQGKENAGEFISHSVVDISIPRNYLKYSLRITNGYLVVYHNLSNKVYEYTDIDVDIIRELDYELYKQLENLEFSTKEELFLFLESIDS